MLRNDPSTFADFPAQCRPYFTEMYGLFVSTSDTLSTGKNYFSSSKENSINPFDPGPLGGMKYFPDRGESGGHVGERIFLIDPLLAELQPCL